MELPAPPPLEGDQSSAVPPESATADSPSAQEWYDIEFAHHRDYLDRWSDGAVTEGSYTRAPFGYLLTGQQFISDTTSMKWTDAEKLAFFGSLARRSRWQPDLIAQDIGGGKTQAQVVQYIEALERERRILKVFQRPRKTRLRKQGWMGGLAPAAREMTSDRIKWEESMAEKLEVKEEGLEEKVARETAREEQVHALEQVANAHRKEALEMEKSLDKDLDAMRPKRSEILKRAKTGFDAAVETAKADYAAIALEEVLRPCDENALKVLDVVVRHAAESTAYTTLQGQGFNLDGTANTQSETEEAALGRGANQILPPPPPIESSNPRHKVVDPEIERRDKERYAYLCRFPVRKLSANHKAEKQVLSKRIRMREKRRESRAAASTTGQPSVNPGTSSNSAENRDQVPNVSNASANTSTVAGSAQDTSDSAEASRTITSPAVKAAPVTPLDLTAYRTHRKDTLDKHALRVEQEQYEKARVDYLRGIPLGDLTEEQRREKTMLAARIRTRERYRAKAAAKVGIDVAEQLGTEIVEVPAADVRLLVLHERKRKRERTEDGTSTAGSETGFKGRKGERQAKRFERYKAEQEEYERLLALSRSHVALSEEEKDRKKKLRIRIKSREYARAARDAKVTAEPKLFETVDVTLTGQGEETSESAQNKMGDTGATSTALQPAAKEPPVTEEIDSKPTPLPQRPIKPTGYLSQKAKEEFEAQKLRRYREERHEYRRLRALSQAKTAMTPEDLLRFRKLGRRIACRKWKRRQADAKTSSGPQRDANDSGEALNITEAGFKRGAKASQPRHDTPLQEVDGLRNPAALPLSGDPNTQHDGLPRVVKPQAVSSGQPIATTDAGVSASSINRSRTRNQHDKDGIGKTRFLQEIRSYHNDAVASLSAWSDNFDEEFESEIQLFLYSDANSVSDTLPQFLYTPQLLAFVKSRRMEMLDLPGIARLLKHAKGEEGRRTVDLTRLLVAFEAVSDLIRNTLKVCIEMNNDPLHGKPEATPIDHDSIVIGLSLLGQHSASTQQNKENEEAEETVEQSLPRIPDAEWVDMVDPADGLFEEDPLAEGDADAEAEDSRLLEMEQQQAVLDAIEDQEYEARIAEAIVRPNAVQLEDAALPMLENDAFDWMMYEQGKDGLWRKLQSKVRKEGLPITWTAGSSETLIPTVPGAREQQRVAQINTLRDTLRETIYQHDKVRWQRIKRIRDPMYHQGSVKQFFTTHKSAAYIDSSDDDGSETEVEEEDELMDSD